MREFVSISFAQFSRAFWERVEAPLPPPLEEHFRRIGGGTVSIGVKVGYWLYSLAQYYQPKTVCEIGTYKGRSATALALGMESGTIWTCDMSVDIPVKSPNEVVLRQHHTSSTKMLKAMTEPVDMFFFDGRIQPDDVPEIARLSHESTVYVLDDFEGLEKGVHNALKLINETKILVTGNERLAVIIPCSISVSHQ